MGQSVPSPIIVLDGDCSTPCFTVAMILGRWWGAPSFFPKITPRMKSIKSSILSSCFSWLMKGVLQWWLKSRTVSHSGSLELSHCVLGHVSEWRRPLCSWESSVQQNVLVFNRSVSWRSAAIELWRPFLYLMVCFSLWCDCHLWELIKYNLQTHVNTVKLSRKVKRGIKHFKEKWQVL